MDEFLDIITPYNLWDGNDLPIGFERTIYRNQLLAYTGNRLVKVLAGQRRVGKSYIMRQAAMALVERGVKRENTLFINRELAVFDFIQNAKDLNDLVSAYRRRFKPQGRIYIFIDEVQEIESWESAVNSMSQDYTSEIEVFISGSNSKLLSGELSTLLSGRYVEIRVFPLSYDEYVDVYSLPRDRESFIRYMRDGGMPELTNLPLNGMRERYMDGLKDSIMLKDIVKRYGVKDVDLLEALFAYLVNNASNMISIPGMVNYMKSKGRKSSYDTVASYIGYLQDAYMVYRVERYNISGKELLGGNFKVYVNDQSYHNYLFPNVRYGSGYLLEGVVYMELLRAGYNVSVGVWNNLEIDFVATSPGRQLYIQVAYMIEDEATAAREYGALEKIKGIGEKLLITLDDVVYPMRNGVLHVQAWRMRETLERRLE
ncbi:MAG: ATP-binding protein [Muribaculaceae bacterium]|nr:ATP-binding protein [Muribaculaceae bacterium]